MGRSLQTHFQVCYSVRGEKLNAKSCNPLLRRFVGILKDFKIEEGDFKAVVSLAGDTIIQEVDTRYLKVSIHLTVEAIDTSPSLDLNLYAMSDHHTALFHRKLRELSLTDGIYSHRIDIKIEDTFQGSEPPMSRENSPWPAARF